MANRINDILSGSGRTKPTVNTAARSVVIAGLAAFLLLFGGIGAWASLTQISGAVIATGQIAVEGKPKTIQHLDGGIIAEIYVRDADLVKQGELLVKLDDTLLRANLEIYHSRLQEALLKQARLEAERDGLDSIIWPDGLAARIGIKIDDAAKAGQQTVFDARTRTRAGQASQIGKKIEQLRNQIEGAQGLLNAREYQLTLIRQELEGLVSLQQQGHTSLTRVLALRREEASILGQTAEIGSQLAQLENAITESEIEVLQIDREFQENISSELVEARAEVNEMTQQLIATRQQLKRVEIVAPVDGVIHELNVFTIGGVISPGEPVMQIIPAGALEMEARVEPQFIDELFVGQGATIRLSAFNQRTTPELQGQIKAISPSTIVDEQTGQPFYKINVDVPQSELGRIGGHALMPGMPVEVFAKTSNRTPLSYLTKPLRDQISRAWREE